MKFSFTIRYTVTTTPNWQYLNLSAAQNKHDCLTIEQDIKGYSKFFLWLAFIQKSKAKLIFLSGKKHIKNPQYYHYIDKIQYYWYFCFLYTLTNLNELEAESLTDMEKQRKYKFLVQETRSKCSFLWCVCMFVCMCVSVFLVF